MVDVCLLSCSLLATLVAGAGCSAGSVERRPEDGSMGAPLLAGSATLDAPHDGSVDAVAISADGRVAVSATDRQIRAWDVTRGRGTCAVEVRPEAPVTQMVVAPTGDRFLVAHAPGHLVVYEPARCTRLRAASAPGGTVRGLIISPEGQVATYGGRRISVGSMAELTAGSAATFDLPDTVQGLAAHWPTRRLAALVGDHESARLALLDMETGRWIWARTCYPRALGEHFWATVGFSLGPVFTAEGWAATLAWSEQTNDPQQVHAIDAGGACVRTFDLPPGSTPSHHSGFVGGDGPDGLLLLDFGEAQALSARGSDAQRRYPLPMPTSHTMIARSHVVAFDRDVAPRRAVRGDQDGHVTVYALPGGAVVMSTGYVSPSRVDTPGGGG